MKRDPIDDRNKELDKFFPKLDKWVRSGDLTVLCVISRYMTEHLVQKNDYLTLAKIEDDVRSARNCIFGNLKAEIRKLGK